MSTDPAFTVEWTVPTAETEWGGDGPGPSSPDVDRDRDADVDRDRDVEATTCTTSEASDREHSSGRDPANPPPAPVLAARVDHLRSERDAAERRADAIRDRYERELAARNEEIRALRASRSRLRAFLDRVHDLF